jgi:hypothetical protein
MLWTTYRFSVSNSSLLRRSDVHKNPLLNFLFARFIQFQNAGMEYFLICFGITIIYHHCHKLADLRSFGTRAL